MNTNRFAKRCTGVLILAATLCVARLTGAQQDKPPQTEKSLTPLNVEIVFSKYKGEELTSRLPYTFVVYAEEQPQRATELRMGIEVPVTVGGEPKVQYRNVGTNLDCGARPLGDGRFQVDLSVEQSSMYPAESVIAGGQVVEGNPLFRTFASNYKAVLRDGEKIELSKATDPITGEISRVELSIEVLKQ